MDHASLILPDRSIPQLIPSARCLSCDVCCRFPEKLSPLAPYFTEEEIQKALRRGIPAERFSNLDGSKIELIPHPNGEGYICPAFDPASNGCRIYDDRPLDCQLFPLALMWDPDRTAVLLGYDRKCPFIVENLFDAAPFEYARTMASRLESEPMLATLQSHPEIIGSFQDDVMILQPLRRLTDLATHNAAMSGKHRSPESLGLTPLTDRDRPLFDFVLKWTPAQLSAYSWPALRVWDDHFQYYWKIIDRQFCLFARYADGLYMPMPPLGDAFSETAVRECFERMDRFNAGPAISRIENVDASRRPFFEAMGFVIREKEREYLYDREALVRLAGDRYKSQRWAYNRFMKEHGQRNIRIEPFRVSDLDECLKLYERWKHQHAGDHPGRRDSTEDQMMLEDAASAHRRALAHFNELGLTGRVVRRDGAIVAYTAGYPFREDIFCVLLEVADRDVTGLSAYLFREFCRELSVYRIIHAMDDSGLERLRRAKLSYHPSNILTSYLVARS